MDKKKIIFMEILIYSLILNPLNKELSSDQSEYLSLLRKEEVKVIFREVCSENVSGYWNPKTYTLCYSNASGNKERTLRHEIIHFLQHSYGVEAVNSFFISSPYCEGNLPEEEEAFIHESYDNSEMKWEKTAWAYSDEPECVQEAINHFY